MMLALSVLLFLGIYIYLDGAGTRTFSFNIIRLGVSFVCNYFIAVLVTNILTEDDRR